MRFGPPVLPCLGGLEGADTSHEVRSSHRGHDRDLATEAVPDDHRRSRSSSARPLEDRDEVVGVIVESARRNAQFRRVVAAAPIVGDQFCATEV
jgi:hypothetical protein